jgi:cytoskeletal protein CcmA (bactofilin family)
MAQIGKSLRLKGEITGSEDLLIDGEVEGTIELKENSLTVGPNGSVKADVSARSITVMGHLCGNVRAGEKIEICKTGSIEGDLSTARIVIEDGAMFRGSIDIVKPGQAGADAKRKAVPIVESPKSAAAAAGRGAGITPQQATLPSRNS